ncbi:hypothetical protein HYS31_08680 [Candidatus Woesearchaeota archaeon]|nr:hypothetical protein [Candidatus Woesearchaeota archaeon]
MVGKEKIIGYSLIAFSLVLFAVLVYMKMQIDEESAFLCEEFHKNKLDMSTCPVHQANSFWSKLSWMVTAAFVIDFLIFAVGVYMTFFYSSGARGAKKEFMEIDLSKLDEDEKKVYELVKGGNGSAYQSDLIKQTGFSKVKVTRVLDKMESKDILEKKRRGMTNIVVLK